MALTDIYYLIHITDKDPTTFERLLSKPCNEPDNGQFPGVYFTLITKDNIDTESYFPGKYCCIFSKKLLLQKNYHINIVDNNGVITEKNTYYPWNITRAVERINHNAQHSTSMYERMNEVVFHDSVDMKYCCKIITESSNLSELLKFYKKGGIPGHLPRRAMTTAEPPDMTKLPFYCYTRDTPYFGTIRVPNSSLRWYKMMTRVAGIDDSRCKTKVACIEEINKRRKSLCKNRDKQNIEILKEYTMK